MLEQESESSPIPSGASRPTEPQDQVESSEYRRLALIVEYDGSDYAGFQIQGDQPTIQGELEGSLTRFTGEALRVRGASRTDSGAHAKGQVVDFLTRSAHSVDRFPKALNYYLPESIKVLAARCVPLSFHSRKDATSRIYRYHILNRAWGSPLRRQTHFWVREALQVPAMSAAARRLVGTQDFRALAPGYPPEKNTVRRVYRWEVWEEEDTVIIESEANGFLKRQIRKANALLIQVGKGRYPENIVSDVLTGQLSAKEECAPVPAHGLCLMEVRYPAISHSNSGLGEYSSGPTGTELGVPPLLGGVDSGNA